VRQVGRLQELYQDAWSTEHKILLTIPAVITQDSEKMAVLRVDTTLKESSSIHRVVLLFENFFAKMDTALPSTAIFACHLTMLFIPNCWHI
jgi:hypothetical protein